MIGTDFPAWVYALAGAAPTVGLGLFKAYQWWRDAETAEAKQEREERERREDRAKAASEQIWREVQRELDRCYKRIDEAEAEAQHWEAQARAQNAAAWEMRGAAADARQALIAARARAGTPDDMPEVWRRPLDVPKIEAPPRRLALPPPAA